MKKVAQQFLNVWKLDFLARFIAKEHRDVKATVVFWIVSQVIVAFFMCVQFAWFLGSAKDDVITAIDAHVPQGAAMRIENGQLSVENVQMPFFREINAKNENGEDESFAVIIDVQAQTYSLNSLDAYSGGVILLSDRAYVKDGGELDQMLYTDVPNFSVSKDQIMTFVHEKYLFPFTTLIVFAALFMLAIGFLVFRSIMALWWALMLFILGMIFDVRIGYAVAYRAVLHMYVVPAIALLITAFAGVNVPYMATVLFLVIFIGNLMWIRKNRQNQEETVVKPKDTVSEEAPKIEVVDHNGHES